MEQYLDLIKAMPVQEQVFTIKKKNWERYINSAPNVAHIINKIFDGKDTIKISRQDLFKYARNHTIEDFIIATIMWGYPKGMRGKHFENLTNKNEGNFEKLKTVLTKAQKDIKNWKEHYKEVKEIPSLGLSTYSKFLYFLTPQVEQYTPLILDLRIIAVIKDNRFGMFPKLTELLSYTNAPLYYLDYLKRMRTLAESMDVLPDQLEMFLFIFGMNLPQSNIGRGQDKRNTQKEAICLNQ